PSRAEDVADHSRRASNRPALLRQAHPHSLGSKWDSGLHRFSTRPTGGAMPWIWSMPAHHARPNVPEEHWWGATPKRYGRQRDGFNKSSERGFNRNILRSEQAH